MRWAEIGTALAMLALAVVVILGTRDLPYWADFAPGGAFMPVWVAVATVLLALALLVEAARRSASEPADWPDRRGLRRVVLIVAGLWAVVALASTLGLITSAAAFILFMLLVVLRTPWLPSLVAVAVTILLIYGIFVAWLGIALPAGTFGP